MNALRKFWFNLDNRYKKVTSITIRFKLVNANLVEVCVNDEDFPVGNPLENVYKTKEFGSGGWDLARERVKKNEKVLRKKANDWYELEKKKQLIQNVSSIIESEIIKGVGWEIRDIETDWITYEEYVELKEKGVL